MDRLEEFLQEPGDLGVKVGGWYKVRVEIAPKAFEYRRMRAVKKFPRFWLFKDERGTRECFSDWYLARWAR